jgi:23S rRNA A1618 N6-methylase RlmF
MCNPPFYESQQEMIEAAQAKRRPPFSVSVLLFVGYISLTLTFRDIYIGVYWCRGRNGYLWRRGFFCVADD